ncbi:probable cyclic nucleotide-gated ion channel 20, chloroplastic isoform X1 [Ipomoea triloba]|uniref:probable cyclic nucleotide-gated ion channel 20, chloroplastic isoform X1 n=1 Tax=Ipomoea triloba TaxID=35885 RepID=UPI00125E6D9B|nr:probable cyclic nucleotide-gated ion channel 20, chloroplastic isoform X1 [Ipomoea triloba]XP_031104453.1 probable cyclic nucleotide-gated ion channel 20, chloroplastic isoform X1 [Ipomoea triloba]
MVAYERDVVPMLSATDSQADESDESRYRRFSYRARRSLSIPANSMEPYDTENSHFGFTGPLRNERRTSYIQMSGPLYIGQKASITNNLRTSQVALGRKSTRQTVEIYPSTAIRESSDWEDYDYAQKNEHLLRSGQLGVCNDPYCTTCPTIDILKAQGQKSKSPEIFDHKFHNMIYGDAKGWAKRSCSFLWSCLPGVMNPHAKVVQRWNKFFVFSCSFAVFIDPLFFFLLTVNQDNKCIVLNWPLTTTIVILRSLTDFIYLIHMLLQFRLAYVAPESRVVGAGDLVDHPKKIAVNYLKGFFLIDLFVVLPLPQIIILLILPDSMGSSGANNAKNLLRAAILVQYVPRLWRFLPVLRGQSSSGFIFESAWANFVINLLTFMLSSHVVGSCWYLFGLQRVNQCLRDACHTSGIGRCREFIDCGHGNDYSKFSSDPAWNQWKNDTNSIACFSTNGFDYGIYEQAVNLTTKHSLFTRYIYSLFWGFQQISTLAGNLVPSYFEWEVLFTMAIIGLGLLLFAMLIGNMQNFLQSLGSRQLEMSMRRRDVEKWMSHRRLPEGLRRRVRLAERYTWAATRGVNEEMLLENLPEDVQRDIRRHLFKFIKKVRIFALVDELVLDAICEKLRLTTYIEGSKVFYRGGLIDKMVFIIRGKMESTGEDGNMAMLSEGDACGEELLTWCLEHSSSVNKDGIKVKIPGHRLLSNRIVRCLSNVEAFILREADLAEVISLFARFLRNPRVQGAIRYESPYWRALAARCIQVAWRYRKKRLSRADSNNSSQQNLLGMEVRLRTLDRETSEFYFGYSNCI